jgi:hypothetical protein
MAAAGTDPAPAARKLADLVSSDVPGKVAALLTQMGFAVVRVGLLVVLPADTGDEEMTNLGHLLNLALPEDTDFRLEAADLREESLPIRERSGCAGTPAPDEEDLPPEPPPQRHRGGGRSYVELDYDEVLAGTEKAFLVQFSGGDEHWLPRGHVRGGEDYERGDGPGTIEVARWLARERGLV